MKLNEFIDKVSYVGKSQIPEDNAECYYSKTDGSYMGRKGLEKECFTFLLDRGITEAIQSIHGGKTACIGFNPEEKKWYGWSHRAIYGFTIGSECNKGHCHYRPKNKEDFIEDCTRFWSDDDHIDVKSYEEEFEGCLGVRTEWKLSDNIPNKKMRGQISSAFSEYPDEFGKGKWKAENIEDAKQMAIDFASGVS